MKAAWFESFGDADKVIQIGDQPKPVVGEGQVLICLLYTSDAADD